MLYTPFIVLALAASGGVARTPQQDYPSCDTARQHSVTGSLGGSIRDPRQAHVSVRANILQADIGIARKAGRLTASEAARSWRQVDGVRKAADGLVRNQGFLSAAERASYDRALDAIARPVCR